MIITIDFWIERNLFFLEKTTVPLNCVI